MKLFATTALVLLFSLLTRAQGPGHSTVVTYPSNYGNGTQTLTVFKPYDTTSSPYRHPVIIAMNGIGERGSTAQAGGSIGDLCNHNATMRFYNQTYSRYSTFIVLTPVLPVTKGAWEAAYVKDAIDYMKANLSSLIDTTQVYVTGLSLGGGGVLNFISDNARGNYYANFIAGAAAFSNTNDWQDEATFFNHVYDNNLPVIVYGCLDDNNANGLTKAAVDYLNARQNITYPAKTPQLKFVRPNTGGHGGGWLYGYDTTDVLTLTVDSSGLGGTTNRTYVNNPNVYRRLLQSSRAATTPVIPGCTTNSSPANTATLGTQTTATLTWNSAAGATNYDIYLWTGATAPGTATYTTTANSYAVSGLTAATTYSWYVVPKNTAGAPTGCIANKTTFVTAAIVNPGNGLTGVYYTGTALSGTPLLTRIDSTINFDLGFLSPAPGTVPTDNYSVRWTGQVQAQFSETYTFFTTADDGIRLWVNGVQLVDNWVNQGATEHNGTITLTAGQKYDIVVEYYEATGGAVTKLSWSGASTPKVIIPATQLYPAAVTPPSCTTNSAPANATTIGSPSGTTLSWAAASGATSYDIFIWSGSTAPSTATYNSNATSYPVSGLSASTLYNWYVAPKNLGGAATGCSSTKTTFTTAASTVGTGLQGVYYNGTALSGAPVLTRVDSTINFDLGFNSPAPGIVPTDNYSVRWTGQVQAQFSETYTFYTLADDGIRLWVNGVQLVDNWVNQGATEHNGSIALVAGQRYDIVLEYYEATGGATTKLSWQSPSTTKAIIPAAQLYPTAETSGSGLRGDYFNGMSLSGTPLLTRTDTTVNFDWVFGSPAAAVVPVDSFSVRWTGKVKAAYSETYTFFTQADDGIRLWVNGVQLVDNWVDQGVTERSGTIALVAGQQYDIKAEYYENSVGAIARLLWSSASTTKAAIPKSALFPASSGARIAANPSVLLPQPDPVSEINTGNTAAIMPNPVIKGQLIKLRINSTIATTAFVSIVNSAGIICKVQQERLIPGVNNIFVNTGSLTRGLHVIKVNGTLQAHTLKVVVD